MNFYRGVVVVAIILYAILGKLADVCAQLLERLWLRWNPAYHLQEANACTARLNPGIHAAAERVTKRYGDNTILNELDLHIPSGQFVAVVGRSGGKYCCYCWQVWKTNAGELLAGATPLAAIQDDTRMMFQDARLRGKQ